MNGLSTFRILLALLLLGIGGTDLVERIRVGIFNRDIAIVVAVGRAGTDARDQCAGEH